MKFGHKLLAAMHPDWAHAYVQYKSLKKTLKGLDSAETAGQAVGEFVGQLAWCHHAEPEPPTGIRKSKHTASARLALPTTQRATQPSFA